MARCLSALVCLLSSATLRAECAYPCWTPTPAHEYHFVSFETVPEPAPEPGYMFSLPYPAQEKGGWSAACQARENYNVDLYRFDDVTGQWLGPLTGPVSRSPLVSYETAKATGRKGIAVRASFTGKADSYDGNTLTDSVFVHSDPCYRASTEFGFSRQVKGLGGDATVYFYYEVNANCKPTGKCRVHGTDRVLVDRRDSIPLATPAHTNSRSGADWLYEAYLVNGGTQWSIHVRDPYTLEETSRPLLHDVQDYWQAIAAAAYEDGAAGYVTATAARNGPVVFSGPPPTMNVVKIWVAK